MKYLLMIATLFTLALHAQTATPPALGDGSSGNPYQIATLNNLYWIEQNSNVWDDNFIQTANINAASTSSWNGGQGWHSIGYSGNPFTGIYDGNGHSILSLTSSYPQYSGEYVGLFGYVGTGAEIKNLNLVGGSLTANDRIGGLAGLVYGATITNCHSSVNITGGNTAGSLIGWSQLSTITSCSATGTVWGWSNLGGLIGISWQDVLISDCFATGTISASSRAGGLIGYIEESVIKKCYATGNIQSYSSSISNDSFGGFTGYIMGLNGMALIEDSYATGNVSCTISGDYTYSYMMGGFVGYNYRSPLINCYSTGSAIGNDNVGGFSGKVITGGTYASTNCFWDTQKSGLSTSADGIGKTTAQMKTQSTFTGWDFSTPVWEIVSGAAYPFLSWQYSVSLAINSNPSQGGTVTGAGEFPPSTPVTITATPNSGFTFINWTNSGSGTIVNPNSASTTFIMTTEAAAITANFQAQLYTLTMSSSNILYGTATDNTGTGPYSAGTIVSITAVPESGYVFTGWESSGGGSFGNVNLETTTFTMPGENVTVTAGFAQGYDLSVIPDDPAHGSAIDYTDDNPYTEGSVITIIAAPAAGYEFQYWTSSGGGTFDNESEIITTFTMPAQNVTLTANFYAVYDLTVTVNNPGMGSATDLTGSNPYPAGFPISIQAVPEAGYIFTKWTSTGGSIHDITSPVTFFAMTDGDVILTANFAVEFSGGSGTDLDPWLISTPYELNNIRNYTGALHSDKYFRQTADISLINYSNWEPIGKIGTEFNQSFYGNYDGAGYSITSLSIDRTGTPDLGLFGVLKEGSITEVNIIDGVIISDDSRNGLIAGYCYLGSITGSTSSGIINAQGGEAGGVTGRNLEGAIENCSSSASVSGAFSVGGIAGANESGTIISCGSTGTISGTNVGIGGLVGQNSTGNIYESYSSGNVTGRGLVGGFVGSNFSSGTINECYSTGNVECTGTGGLGIKTGGFAGENFDSEINNSYSMGRVTGSDNYTGGFAGYNYQQDLSSLIDNCYSKGSVSGSGITGGFCAYNNSTITDCFWDTDLSGLTSSSGGSGGTTAEMNSYSTFEPAGWDFKYLTADGTGDIWYIDTINNSKYPWLAWQNLPLQPATSYAISSTQSSATLSWDGALGATYDVYSSDDPNKIFPDEWYLEASGVTDPDWVDNNVSSVRGKFYRTVVVYPY
ncbi:MAG: GLUG motif-containing protein [Candidatus Delongbacteria bacterium]|nr:GLUG motif-containing protein [Candidatus Delongbacteria bacterium]